MVARRQVVVEAIRRPIKQALQVAVGGDESMRRDNFPWVGIYEFTEPGITAEGVRVYPFNRSFPIDVSFQRALGPSFVRLNRHEFFEIMYLYTGKVSIQVRDRILPAKAGDLVIIGPNLYHRVLYKPNVEVKLVSMNFQPEIIRSGKAAGEEEHYLSPFLCQGSRFPHVITGSPNLSKDVFDLILKIYSELPGQTLLHRMATRNYLNMILLLLLKHYTSYLHSRETVDQDRRKRLQPVFELLDRNFAQPITVQDGARACAMSTSHFMRYFKMNVGQTFRSYLTSFRIAKAQYLLQNKEIPIAEISQLVGFCSQSYFGEVFQAVVGMTPRTYRKRSSP
jgi:AraC-like DNA-binding protein